MGAIIAARDLTQGSIPEHLVKLATPVILAMLLQSAYALIDLYWVRFLGTASVAALSISLQAFFIILALAQVVAVTALAQISQSYGAGDLRRAHGLFSGFLVVSTVIGLIAAISAYLGAEPYVRFFAPDPSQFIPGSIDQDTAIEVIIQGLDSFEINAITFCTQVIIIVLGNGFRGGGDFLTPVKLMVAAVLINLVLDPILIFGLGGFPEMGLAGAAWATVIAQVLALVGYAFILLRPSKDERSVRLGTPILDRRFFVRLVQKGLPVGIQFALLPIFLGLILYAMKPWGPDWTATAGAGFRVLQQTLLPMVAVGHATADRWTELWCPLHNRVQQASWMATDGWLSTVWLSPYSCSLPVELGQIFANTEEALDLFRFTIGGRPPLFWFFRLVSSLIRSSSVEPTRASVHRRPAANLFTHHLDIVGHPIRRSGPRVDLWRHPRRPSSKRIGNLSHVAYFRTIREESATRFVAHQLDSSSEASSVW